MSRCQCEDPDFYWSRIFPQGYFCGKCGKLETEDEPTCPKCGRSDAMTEGPDGWTCHHTHPID